MFRGPVLTDDDDVDQGCQVFCQVHRAGRVWPTGRMFDTPDVDDFVADTVSCLYIYIFTFSVKCRSMQMVWCLLIVLLSGGAESWMSCALTFTPTLCRSNGPTFQWQIFEIGLRVHMTLKWSSCHFVFTSRRSSVHSTA